MNSSENEHVKEEIADIMIYLIRFADKLDIDLDTAVADKIVKNLRIGDLNKLNIAT